MTNFLSQLFGNISSEEKEAAKKVSGIIISHLEMHSDPNNPPEKIKSLYSIAYIAGMVKGQLIYSNIIDNEINDDDIKKLNATLKKVLKNIFGRREGSELLKGFLDSYSQKTKIQSIIEVGETEYIQFLLNEIPIPMSSWKRNVLDWNI